MFNFVGGVSKADTYNVRRQHKTDFRTVSKVMHGDTGGPGEPCTWHAAEASHFTD